MPLCTKQDWLLVKKPSKSSHKGQNGRLLILAGSKTYHGALVLAIKAAVRFCDLVYVYTHETNDALLAPLKLQTPNIIVLTPRTISQFFQSIDAFLAGPGWEQNPQNKMLLEKMLKTKKPIVIDATALRLLNLSSLHKNALLTPHKGEFESLFKLEPTEQNAKAMAKKHNCTILLKGPTDCIASPVRTKLNKTGNAGMTKGGTGDVLAGLAAALISSGTTPYKAACAASYLNGYAADCLSKSMGTHFSSEDLAQGLASCAKELEAKKSK
ncbi:MAG: NAD(P)H-hydrate dehydratase [Candidatus Micrarchaeota archaeon]